VGGGVPRRLFTTISGRFYDSRINLNPFAAECLVMFTMLRPPYLNFLIGENRHSRPRAEWQRIGPNDSHLIDLADRQRRAGNAQHAIELNGCGRFWLRFDDLAGDASTTQVRSLARQYRNPPIEPYSPWKEGGAFELLGLEGLRNLKLFYRRQAGTTRAEGRIELRKLRLEVLL
jgi:hypothetical protein